MNFQYIDIGTSDFSTSIPLLKPGEMGLYVEPIFHYLANLPNLPGVVKAPFAISDKCGYGTMYYVAENNIHSHQLPQWVRGCNSFNRPHQLLSRELDQSVPVEKLTVPCITFEELLRIYHVDTARCLNIDTEGHDHVILAQVLLFVEKLQVERIMFEYIRSNDNVAELDQLLAQFHLLNFTAVTDSDNIILTRT